MSTHNLFYHSYLRDKREKILLEFEATYIKLSTFVSSWNSRFWEGNPQMTKKVALGSTVTKTAEDWNYTNSKPHLASSCYKKKNILSCTLPSWKILQI